MESAASSALHPACAQCGLPVTPKRAPNADAIFCCQGCRLVALILGKEQGEQGANLLRLGLGTLFAMNIMMISLLLYSGGIEPETVPAFRLLLLILATPALAILIPPFFAGALRECFSRKGCLDALIACGSLAAFSISAFHTLRGAGSIFFDTATMLPVLVTFGKMIEGGAKSRAADLLHSLESLLPRTALRMSRAGAAEIPIGDLQKGDLIRVRPGERIAVDGRIREGNSSIEEASFTGECMPRICGPGDSVIAGTVNVAGSLLVEAERTGTQLLLNGIAAMIQDAWRNPSSAERIAERAAALFLPALLVLALGSFLCWCSLGNPDQGLLCALSVLVVACPCTIGIATPLATSLAIARAAREGVVVRGGSVMERLAGIELIFLDKTGTVTTGEPVLREIRMVDTAVEEGELLGRVAALETASGHILARAVAAAARKSGCAAGSVVRARVQPGCGISGAVTWRGSTNEVVAGTAGFVECSLATSEAPDDTAAGADHHGGHTVVEVAWDGKLRGRLLFSEAIRPEARRCVQVLADLGISSALLSGDRLPAAAAIAKLAGIARVEAPRTPEHKFQTVTDSIAAGKIVAMVGDGVNDAPALAAAHLGIAFGTETDLARQAGNIVILSERLLLVPWLIGLSRKTGSIIRGNFAWSFGYNAIALGAAATGWLHPLLAALAMVFSSCTVLGNSLRIIGYPAAPPPGD